MPKRCTDGCRAVLPELIFVQARQSPQRILDVFARVLTRHELNPTGQNRHGFKSRQPVKLRRLIKTYTANGLRRPTCLIRLRACKVRTEALFLLGLLFCQPVRPSFFFPFPQKSCCFSFRSTEKFPECFSAVHLAFYSKKKTDAEAPVFSFLHQEQKYRIIHLRELPL